MKKEEIEKMAKQYCRKKVKTKKFSDDWQPLSISEMVEFAEIVVNKFSSNLPVGGELPLKFTVWYSGMTEDKIKNAFERWKTESGNCH